MSAPEHPPHSAGAASRRSDANWRLVVIATSAGGLKPLMTITAALPVEFPAAVAVVQHRSEQFPDLLPTLLAPRAALSVRTARDGETLEPGNIYLCPPGMHMTADAMLQVMEAPKLNYVRPSADLMFYSAAQTYASRAIGVVLSGTGTDGALGCRAIVDAGGTVIAQSAESCAYPSMPTAAAMLGPAQLVLAPEAIGPALEGLVAKPARPQPLKQSPAGPGLTERKAGVTTVLLADDHQIIRDGLRVLLRGEPDLTVVGETADGRATVESAAMLAPDVVVMDLAMPGLNGIEATRQICAQNPSIKVIVLSAQTDLGSISGAFEAGAVGFLGKQKAFDELLLAIRTIVSTGEYLSRDLR